MNEVTRQRGWQWRGRGCGPIGLDIGATGLRMAQLSRDGRRIHALGRRDLPPPEHDRPFPPDRVDAIISAIASLRRQHAFRGKQVVVVLNDRQLFIQNIRVPRVADRPLTQLIYEETAGRLPYSVGEAELRFHLVGEVRQGERVYREAIVFATPIRTIEQIIGFVDKAGLQVCAMETEPGVLVRCMGNEFRRDEDRSLRTLLVHIGATRSVAMVLDGYQPLLIKYLALGGEQFDKAVADQLELDIRAAGSLRRHHGDRRADRRDPEVAATVAEAIRPVTEKLVSELAMCTRYYSVTFRRKRIDRLVTGGGEATEDLTNLISERLHLPGVISNPIRHMTGRGPREHAACWNVAIGAALRGTASAAATPSQSELEGAAS